MNLVYWISTSVISVFLVLSALSYLFHEPTIDGVRDLGFPDYFRIQLAVLKLMASTILLLPIVSVSIKEWAYAGVGFFLLTAIVAHTVNKDALTVLLVNVVLLVILGISNYCFVTELSSP